MGPKGFTLVEIVLVLIIMAVVWAMVLPNFSGVSGGLALRQTAEDLTYKARWAQIMAMGQRRIYAMAFASDLGSYKIVRASLKDESHPVFEKAPGPMGRAHHLPLGVGLNVSKDLIEFYPDGTIDPATIELSGHKKKILLSSMAKIGVLKVVDDQ